MESKYYICEINGYAYAKYDYKDIEVLIGLDHLLELIIKEN